VEYQKQADGIKHSLEKEPRVPKKEIDALQR
jgi:hypothetical protein